MDERLMPKLLSEFRIVYDKCISKALKEEGLDDFETSYGLIVRALSIHSKLTMKELAETITRDKSTVTVLVRKLEQKGYVQRLCNPDDQRSNFIALTEKSRNVADTLEVIGSNVNEQIWQEIEEKEITQFMNTLVKITDNLSDCDKKKEGDEYIYEKKK